MSDEPYEIRPRALADLGRLEHSYGTLELPRSRHPVLVVRIAGALGKGWDEPHAFKLASAIIMAGLEAWEPWALVLDFGRLAYSWGDEMQNVLTAPERWYEALRPVRTAFGGEHVPASFPVAVIVSELNREGLVSLVQDELKEDPNKMLYDSMSLAIRYFDDLLIDVPVL